MFNAIANAFRIPDLRKKILFTLGMITLYRIGSFVPVPGVDVSYVENLVGGQSSLAMLNLFTGGALSTFSIFALGIMPYITSSIIMQLLQAAIPALERLRKEGESGQRKITQITRYMTLGIGLIEAIGLLFVFSDAMVANSSVPSWLTSTIVVISLLAGTALIMWLAELISQRGIGNGMSVLIFTNIVSRFPQALVDSIGTSVPMTVVTAVVILGVVMAVIYIDRGQRRIPVQYAKRVVGRKVYGGSSTYIPLKVNGANVVPIIFATAILSIPVQMVYFFPNTDWLITMANALSSGWVNWLVTFVLIVFFSYFYTALVFNPIELSDNLRKQGGFIPGIRPGQLTTEHIETVMNRIILPGALFLGVIAVGTSMLFQATNSQLVSQLGGTSILIMVGVALETMTQIESQLKMRHYDGFFK